MQIINKQAMHGIRLVMMQEVTTLKNNNYGKKEFTRK